MIGNPFKRCGEGHKGNKNFLFLFKDKDRWVAAGADVCPVFGCVGMSFVGGRYEITYGLGFIVGGSFTAGLKDQLPKCGKQSPTKFVTAEVGYKVLGAGYTYEAPEGSDLSSKYGDGWINVVVFNDDALTAGDLAAMVGSMKKHSYGICVSGDKR